MNKKINESLGIVLRNWEQMQSSDADEAENDADRFQDSFYAFIEQVRKWMTELEVKPTTLAEALELPEIAQIVEQLPVMLYLNFETELDLIIEGTVRVDDQKYD